jgi:Zn-dependent protease with chaperone function
VDFFRAQALARQRTWRLIGLFAAAVLALILATNVLIAVVAGLMTPAGIIYGAPTIIAATPPSTWLGISSLVVFVIAAASLYKWRQLRSGGRAVAEVLGARPVLPSTTELRERRLLNVVEEMAIAAGMPVPPVYVLEDERSINAFAAGLGTQDAIIGVTRGCLDHLERDELQGVVGHEFSHILNGDTHLNLRLVSLLHGILFLGLVGEAMMRSGRRQRDRHALAFAGLGLGLWAIGYAGTFFGNLIKAAVNRQREYLADASAVQFTRNPTGIAGALKKIGGTSGAGRLIGPRSHEVSHMFFGQAVSFGVERLFATHPPLETRIRALEPRWDGRFASVAEVPSTVKRSDGLLPPAGMTAFDDGVVRQVGHLERDSLSVAHTRIDGLPAQAHAAAKEPAMAFALVHALFLGREQAARIAQSKEVASVEGSAVTRDVERLSVSVRDCDPVQRLTLIALAAPALKLLLHGQYHRLLSNVRRLVAVDASVDLTEWVMYRILHRELAAHFGDDRIPSVRTRSTAQRDAALATLLSAIANAIGGDAAAKSRAFAQGATAAQMSGHSTTSTGSASAHVSAGHALRYDPEEDRGFARLNRALRVLRSLPPLHKPRIIKACAACALAGGAAPSARALLAGIAATLDCPLPPDFQIRPPTGS